jgi:hypothetical protein
MRRIAILLIAMTALLVQTAVAGLQAQREHGDFRDRGDFQERDEIRQTYQIAPGASVEISNINGPLEIETVSGNTAEIYVVRTARTKADLEYHKIIIENTPSTFKLYGAQDDENGNRVTVRHRAVLKLPRPSALSVRNINGTARVGDVDGPITLGNINGRLEIGVANDFAELSNINGSTNMTIAQLGSRGIQMRNMNGSINIRFLSDVNADLEVHSFNGSVNSSLPNMSIQKTGRSEFKGQIGAGGIPITGTHVNGAISIRRGSDTAK